jgi:tetratricopeptide (TPR) repeat protein
LDSNAERCSYCHSLIVIKTDHPKINPQNLKRAVIDEHIAGFRRTVRRDPFDELAHYGLGVAYFNLGLNEYAVEELAHAARLMPENPNIHIQLAVVLWDLVKNGERDYKKRLLQAVDTVLKLDPEHIEGLLLYVDILMGDKDYKSAGKILTRVKSLDPVRSFDREKDVLKARIEQQLDKDDSNSAEALLRELFELDSEAATEYLRELLTAYNDDLPLLLVNDDGPDQLAASLRTARFIAFLLGAALALTLAAIFPDAASIGLVLAIGAGFAFYHVIRTRNTRRLRQSAVAVTRTTIENGDFNVLLVVRDALEAFENGTLINLAER